jgi:hypothetical protein
MLCTQGQGLPRVEALRYRVVTEMDARRHTRSSAVRVLALSLAVLSVLLVAQALSHSHAKGQNETACQICQAARVGPGPAAGFVSLSSPLIAAGYVQPFVLAIHHELFVHDSPSRAPPAA